MKAIITLSREVKNSKRAVLYNSELSHHINEQDLQEALKDSASNMWKSSPEGGAALGAVLFRFLNGSSGKLHALLDESFTAGEPLFLSHDMPFELTSLPFELLWDGGFVLLRNFPHLSLSRIVSSRKRMQRFTPVFRSLRLIL
jgi:hypothetical protein